MHIGFLIMNIKNAGGTERVTSIIANGLAERGYKISIVSCREGDISHFKVDKRVTLLSLHGEKEKNFLLRKFKSFKELKKIVEKENIDIMIAVDIALYIYLFPLRKKIKTIAWEHFTYYTSIGWLEKISQHLAVRFSNYIVVLSKADLENYKRNNKRMDQIKCIYNPLAPMKKEKINISRKCVISVGRLSREKGFDRLVEIWEKVEQQNKEWHLHIYGDGELKEELQNQIDSKHLKNIKLCGYAQNVEEKYLEGSIFALSSRYEGFGMVLLEAQEMGMPCISFNCKEGPAEIISNGINGFLIEDGNIERYAEKLLLMMRDDDLRRSFSEKADKDHAKYNIDTVLTEWENLFLEI